VATAELCRQHGISEQTYYRWKAKYGGMDSSEAKRLKNQRPHSSLHYLPPAEFARQQLEMRA
jgi:hypothetical protein